MIDNIEMPLSMGNFIIPLKRKALNSVWQPRISYNPLVKHVKCWSDGRGQTPKYQLNNYVQTVREITHEILGKG